jgi:hypothetical protein
MDDCMVAVGWGSLFGTWFGVGVGMIIAALMHVAGDYDDRAQR